ncbi:hypothetical protein GCM10023311_24180 [Flaviramulus aquimarinus]|uniref:WG repeat-containing protein n=1 Tax=Flaviramulus aquimarinus TaxID=1170456 RepID=A0ABP9FBB4_9FLAO
MRKITCFLVFIFTTISFSQNKTNLKITESKAFTDKVMSQRVVSIHSTPNGLTGVIRISKKGLLFDVFDASLERIKNGLIRIETKEKYHANLSFGNSMKIFTIFSPSRKERVVYCHEFNLVNKTYKKTKLFKADVEKRQSIFSGSNKRETGFAISPNGDYFVVSTDDIKKHSNSYTVRVYNSKTLELIYKKKFQENTEKYYSANDLSIDDNATVYALGKLFLEGRYQKKDGKANYDFIFNKISNSEIQTKKVSFDKERHISSLIISNINNKIQLIGFYSDKKAGRIKGTLMYDVDTLSMDIKALSSYKLPEMVYKDLYSTETAKSKKDKGAELSSYYVDYVITDSKENIYLLAEEFFITQVYVSNGMNGGYTQTTYHYNNILVIKLNKEGELEWGRSIFKRANSPSYNAFVKDDELHVILNSGKNLTDKGDGRVKVSKGWFESTSLFDIVFNEKGKVQYNKIQDNKGKTFYKPYYGVYDGERFITISRSSGKKQFLILE